MPDSLQDLESHRGELVKQFARLAGRFAQRVHLQYQQPLRKWPKQEALLDTR